MKLILWAEGKNRVDWIATQLDWNFDLRLGPQESASSRGSAHYTSRGSDTRYPNISHCVHCVQLITDNITVQGILLDYKEVRNKFSKQPSSHGRFARTSYMVIGDV